MLAKVCLAEERGGFWKAEELHDLDGAVPGTGAEGVFCY